MGIIQDTIKRYLDNKYVDRVIVSGMDGSGKTTMLKELITDYNYIKYSYKMDLNQIDTGTVTSVHQLFDRHPIIDYYVYGEHPDTIEFNEVSFDYFKRFTRKYIPRTLYIIYLHTMFLDDKYNEPDWVAQYHKIYYDRYLEVIKWIGMLRYPVIVVTDKSFFLKNGIY